MCVGVSAGDVNDVQRKHGAQSMLGGAQNMLELGALSSSSNNVNVIGLDGLGFNHINQELEQLEFFGHQSGMAMVPHGGDGEVHGPNAQVGLNKKLSHLN